jgi:hypothetical protein
MQEEAEIIEIEENDIEVHRFTVQSKYFRVRFYNEDIYESASFLASNVRKWYADHDILAHANLIYLPIIRHFARNHFRY